MASIRRIAEDLYYYNGGDTANALGQSYWNDDVGRAIKERIEYIVGFHLDGAKSYYAHRLNTIQTEDIENALQLAWAHLRG